MLESISCLFFSWLLFPFFVSSLYFPPWFVSFSSSFSLFNYRSDYLFTCHELNIGNVCSLTVIRYEEMTSLVFFFKWSLSFFLPLLLTSAWYLNWWQLIHDIYFSAQTLYQNLFVQWIAWNLYFMYCFSSKGWTVFIMFHVSCIYNIKSIKNNCIKKKNNSISVEYIYISLVSLYMWPLPHPVCINSLIRCNLYKCHQQSLFNNKEIINVLQKVYDLLFFMSFQTTRFLYTYMYCVRMLWSLDQWWFG